MRTWKGNNSKYAHVKRDGHSITLQKKHSGLVSFLTPKTDITAKCRGYSWYANAVRLLPGGYTLQGELWCPGHRASSIKTLLNAQHPDLRWQPYQVNDLPDDASLETVAEFCDAFGLEFIRPFYTDWNFERLRVAAVTDNDVEGWVFKDGNRLNHSKWKPEPTIDLIVTGLNDGTGQFLGLVGSLQCKTIEGHTIANVGGMDFDTRLDAEFSVGRVVEVKYQYVNAKGRLRHPRFVRWRDDKRPEQCSVSQDPNLEAYYS